MLLNKLILPKGKKIAEINEDLAELIFNNFENIKQKKSKLSKMFLSRSHIIAYVGTEYGNHIYVSLALPTENYNNLLLLNSIQNKDNFENIDQNEISKHINEKFTRVLDFLDEFNIPFLTKEYNILKHINQFLTSHQIKQYKKNLTTVIKLCEEKVCDYLERVDEFFNPSQGISEEKIREQYSKIESGRIKIPFI